MTESLGIVTNEPHWITAGPEGIGYVAADSSVDGEAVTLENGRSVKKVSLDEFESVFTLRTVRADGSDVAEADPMTGYLAPAGVHVQQVRDYERDVRKAVWFPMMPTDAAPEGDPNTASAEVLTALSAALAESAPNGWSGLTIECEALGLAMVITITVTMADGSSLLWSPPVMISQWLQRLRMRDFHPGRGVWVRARFELAPGGALMRDVDSLTPPGFLTNELAADELRMMPRNVDAVPRWLLDAAVRSQQAVESGWKGYPPLPGHADFAPLFDGRGANGKFVWYRPMLSEWEKPSVLEYLENAPVVLAARGRSKDELSDSDEQVVPMAFSTDGRFVWSRAAIYYLRTHNVPPALPLMEHIRAQRHKLPDVVPAIAKDRGSALAMRRPRDDVAESEKYAREALPVVESVILSKKTSPRYYSFFAEKERAWCLVRDGDRYRVELSGNPRTKVMFDDVEHAAVYMAGQLLANASKLEYEDGEELPAWQAPIRVLGDDPKVDSFSSISMVKIAAVEVDRYGEPDGNLVFEADTPFEKRGLPPEFANRPYHRYRLDNEKWHVVALVSAAGGRGYVLPKAISEYLKSGYLTEIARPAPATPMPAAPMMPGAPAPGGPPQPGHPGLPPINDGMRAAAAQNPGGWVYCADPDVDPRFIEGMPMPVLLGGYKIGPDGQFTGETYINNDYRPSPRLRGYPAPQSDFELVLGYIAAGWLTHDRILPVVLNSVLLVETDANRNMRIGVDNSGRRFLVVYSSPRYVPPGAPGINQLPGRELLRVVAGTMLIVNPGGNFGIELPGDDLIRFASGVPR